MLTPTVWLLCVLLSGPGDPLAGDGSVQDVSASELHTLHRVLTGGKSERWESIPWSTDLLEAARRARQKRQPLFMWAMNGHPLGCV